MKRWAQILYTLNVSSIVVYLTAMNMDKFEFLFLYNFLSISVDDG